MTIDRAIEILDPEHRENYDGMDEVNEACRMGMEALERTRWIPCSERLPESSLEVLGSPVGRSEILRWWIVWRSGISTETKGGFLKCGRSGKTRTSPTGSRCLNRRERRNDRCTNAIEKG